MAVSTPQVCSQMRKRRQPRRIRCLYSLQATRCVFAVYRDSYNNKRPHHSNWWLWSQWEPGDGSAPQMLASKYAEQSKLRYTWQNILKTTPKLLALQASFLWKQRRKNPITCFIIYFSIIYYDWDQKKSMKENTRLIYHHLISYMYSRLNLSTTTHLIPSYKNFNFERVRF